LSLKSLFQKLQPVAVVWLRCAKK